MPNPLFLFKDFRNIFISRMISAIGDKFFTISLLWWVINQPNGKQNVSLIMSAVFLPVVIFSPFTGAVVDNHDKKKLMLIADFSRAFVLFVLLLFLIYAKLNIYILFILVFMVYSISPLFENSVASSLVYLTSKEHLSQAAALDSTSIQISNVIGAMAGSVLIAAIGFNGAVSLNIATYLLSFLFILFIKKNLNIKSSTKVNYFSELKEGFSYVYGLKYIFRLLVFFGLLNFFVSPILIIIPMIVKFIYSESVKWLAIFETFFAIGTLLGSFIMSFKRDIKWNIELLMVSVIMFAVSFFLTSYIKNIYMASFFLFLCGFSLSLGNVAVISYFQNTVDDEYKGRFFSLVNTIVYAIMPFSFIVNGFMAEKMSVELLIMFNSSACFLLGIYGFMGFRDKV